jgi:uncharacterized delta-60 repeat protein
LVTALKLFARIAAVASLILMASTPTVAAPGDLDPSFGTAGVVVGNYPFETRIAIQPDEKIILAATGGKTSVLITRFFRNGSVDSSFATDGLDLSPQLARIGAVAVDSEGRILVSGARIQDATFSSSQTFVSRLTATGQMDATFGANGIVLIPGGGLGAALAIQRDGKVVVGGVNLVARLLVSGQFDTGFGTNGVVALPDVMEPQSIAIQSDDHVVVAGYFDSLGPTQDFQVIRMTPVGQVDTTFGGTGVVHVAFGTAADVAFGAVVDFQDRIVVSGNYATASCPNVICDQGVALTRLLPNGTIDTQFGSGGKVESFLAPSEFLYGYGVALQPDGKLLVAARELLLSGDIHADLMRYEADGIPDAQFGTNGRAVISLGVNSVGLYFDLPVSLALDPNGTAIVSDYNGATLARLLLNDSNDDSVPEAWNLVPAAVTFNAATGVPPNTLQTSNRITITGLGAGLSVPVRVSGGEFALNGSAAFRSSYAFVSNGDQITVRHTSASAPSTTVSTALLVGGVLDSHAPGVVSGAPLSVVFTSTTAAAPVNHAPQITSGGGTFTVAESAAAGSAITVIAATDVDNDPLSYSITAGNAGTAFAIDSAGHITVATTLQAKQTPTFTLTVQVADGRGGTATTAVIVNVTAVNHPPAIAGGSGTFSLSDTSPAGSAVTTITATDPDSDSLTFAITAGNTGNAFAVDSTGYVTVASALNAKQQASYALTVQVSDGRGGTVEATVNVTVTPVIAGGTGTSGEKSGGGGAVDALSLIFLTVLALLYQQRSRNGRPHMREPNRWLVSLRHDLLPSSSSLLPGKCHTKT